MMAGMISMMFSKGKIPVYDEVYGMEEVVKQEQSAEEMIETIKAMKSKYK